MEGQGPGRAQTGSGGTDPSDASCLRPAGSLHWYRARFYGRLDENIRRFLGDDAGSGCWEYGCLGKGLGKGAESRDDICVVLLYNDTLVKGNWILGFGEEERSYLV